MLCRTHSVQSKSLHSIPALQHDEMRACKLMIIIGGAQEEEDDPQEDW